MRHATATIVPSWDEKPRVEGYRPDELYDDYLKARDAPGSDSVDDILRAMRQHQANADGIRPGTAIPDGRKQRSCAVTANDHLSFQCEDSPASPIANGTCVRKRLEFPRTPPICYIRRKSCCLERFQNLGNHVEWIPRDIEKRTATNDFRWIETQRALRIAVLGKS